MQGDPLMTWAVRQAWALEPDYLGRVAHVVHARSAREATPGLNADERLRSATREERNAGRRTARAGSVAVIPVYGLIVHRAGMVTEYSGGTSAQALVRAVREAVDSPDVNAIVLDVDSPGGSVAGVVEAADELRRARDVKPLFAVANTQAASAAYWLAAQASQLAVTPSGTVGSIGVYMLHEDLSGALDQAGIRMTYVHAGEHKVEGNNYEPLAAPARREMQAHVDACYTQFVDAIARGRRVSSAHVRKAFGQGRLVRPADALAAGMVDRIATLDDVVAEAQGQPARQGSATSTASARPPAAASRTPRGTIEIYRRRLRLTGL